MGMNHANRAFAGDMAPDEVVTLQLIDARSDLIDVGSAGYLQHHIDNMGARQLFVHRVNRSLSERLHP